MQKYKRSLNKTMAQMDVFTNRSYQCNQYICKLRCFKLVENLKFADTCIFLHCVTYVRGILITRMN